ncbi:Trk family potassium uptake protein [candidate division WOR-3 bacterium]|nr:Trk family potassium uptake protein [candidate division WOR-3 bacterium]
MIRWSPFRYISAVYILIILFGAVLLKLPLANRGLSFIDSLFTSTSAICVTGLIVKDTALDFTLAGKAIILFLIQTGGMGYMAVASLFMTIFAIKPDKRQNIVVQQEFGLFSRDNTLMFLRLVVLTTFIFEMLGFIFLYLGFKDTFNVNETIVHAIFHSVSAFCNAGFSSFSDNLGSFANNPIIGLTASFLFIIGGLGFIVIIDILERLKGEKRYLTEHSRIVIFSTLILIVLGFTCVYALEYGNILAGKESVSKFIISFFTAATPRTAGFSLINISALLPTTLLIIVLLMFIGASPGGTGGGIKTTTFVIISNFFTSRLKGLKSVNIEKRRIPEEQVNKALTLFLISLILIVTMIGILSFTERNIVNKIGILPIIFEEVSAFGTVGLSMGSSVQPVVSLSHDFTFIGKLIIIITMLAGRIGPLTLVATVLKKKSESFQYPLAKVQIG